MLNFKNLAQQTSMENNAYSQKMNARILIVQIFHTKIILIVFNMILHVLLMD